MLLNRILTRSFWGMSLAVMGGVGGSTAVSPAATVFEGEAVRVEFLEVAEVTQPGVPVALRFTVENRGPEQVGGSLAIGGPTRGIILRGDPAQPFKVEGGETLTVELSVEFAGDCVEGLYPVHAFLWLEEGAQERAVLSRLVRTAYGRVDDGKQGEGVPGLAQFRPAPEENVIDQFFETKRLSVMADYVRSLDSSAGRAFRLGEGEGAYRVMVVPGRQGLLDGYLYFTGPGPDFYFRGLWVTLRGPAGVDVSGTVEVEGFREERRESGLWVSHQVRMGEWETVVDVEVMLGEGMVSIRCDSPDPVVEVALGECSLASKAVTCGMGHRLERPEGFSVGEESSLLSVRYAAFDFEEGVQLVMGSEEPLRALRVVPEERHASVAVPGRQWLRLAPGAGRMANLKSLPRGNVAQETDGAARQVPVIWFRRFCRDLPALEGEIREWSRLGGLRAGLILEEWQAGGREMIPPDVWPPGEEQGGMEGLAGLARVCQESGVTLVLADRYGEISPLSRGFLFDAVEFGDDGRPVEASPGRSYRLRPDAALAYFEENWQQIGYHVKPGGLMMGGMRGAGGEFFDSTGRRYPASWVRERWRANLARSRELAGEGGLIVSEGGGDWLMAAADVVLATAGGKDREGLSRVPWWNLFSRGALPVLEAFRENGRYPLSRMAERAMDGRLLLFEDDAWMSEMLSRSWLLGPVLEKMRRGEVKKFGPVDARQERWEMTWSTGLTVWRNLGADPWLVGDREVPPGGFWAEGPGLSGGTEIREGILCEGMDSEEGRYVFPSSDGRGRIPAPLEVESLIPAAGEQVELSLVWDETGVVPSGARLRFFLSSRREADDWKPWGGDAIRITDALPRRALLPADAVPAGEEVWVFAVLENAGGRRLAMEQTGDGAGEETDRVLLGRLRKTGGEVSRWEGAWRKMEQGRNTPSSRPSVDFGWIATGGGVLLRETDGEWQLHPIPHQGAFDLSIKVEELGERFRERAVVRGRVRASGEWERISSSLRAGALSFRVEPRYETYEILLEEKGAVAGPGEVEAP